MHKNSYLHVYIYIIPLWVLLPLSVLVRIHCNLPPTWRYILKMFVILCCVPMGQLKHDHPSEWYILSAMVDPLGWTTYLNFSTHNMTRSYVWWTSLVFAFYFYPIHTSHWLQIAIKNYFTLGKLYEWLSGRYGVFHSPTAGFLCLSVSSIVGDQPQTYTPISCQLKTRDTFNPSPLSHMYKWLQDM